MSNRNQFWITFGLLYCSESDMNLTSWLVQHSGYSPCQISNEDAEDAQQSSNDSKDDVDGDVAGNGHDG
jgi:hypothetical protein